jgi:peptidoglycan hydrolase CwlO-like protein
MILLTKNSNDMMLSLRMSEIETKKEMEGAKLFGVSIGTIFQTLLITAMIGLYTKFDQVVTQSLIQEEKIKMMSQNLSDIKSELKEINKEVKTMSKTQEGMKVKIDNGN